MTRALVLFVALGAILGLDSRPACADALDDAKRIAKQASIEYQLGHFNEAMEAYSRSYQTVQTPGLLFNIGQCNMMLKQYERAIFLFEGYLQNKPDAQNAALVHDLIAEARRELAAKRERDAAAETERMNEMVKAAQVSRPISFLPVRPTDPKRTAAVILGASSIALVGAGVYLGMRADLADGFGTLSTAAAAKARSTHRDFVVASSVVGGIGAGAAIASGVLGYLSWRHPKGGPKLSLAPSTQGAAAFVAGSF